MKTDLRYVCGYYLIAMAATARKKTAKISFARNLALRSEISGHEGSKQPSYSSSPTLAYKSKLGRNIEK